MTTCLALYLLLDLIQMCLEILSKQEIIICTAGDVIMTNVTIKDMMTRIELMTPLVII